MKKKPPPGATLIARLKEQRLAREAELARKQAESAANANPPAPSSVQEPAPAPSEAATKSDTTKPVTAAQPAAPALSVESTSSEETSVEYGQPEDVTPVDTDVHHQSGSVPAADADSSVPPAGNRQTVVVSSRVRKPATPVVVVETARAQAADLLHREIDISDLRPTTDDYFVLTDEIRLAGRFAAVGLIAQGLRLQRLRDDQIYKDHYGNFEDYCRKEHQMSATYAYRLIRMAEMAERVAQLGHRHEEQAAAANDAMPDPFEVMLGLGHRHLMALLPLEVETARELLINGIPLETGEENGTSERVPMSRATEKQIREALKAFSPATEKTAVKVVPKQSLASEKQLIPALNKLVEMLEDWALWLGGDPPPELQAARMGRGPLLNRLAKRFRAASGRIADALQSSEE